MDEEKQDLSDAVFDEIVSWFKVAAQPRQPDLSEEELDTKARLYANDWRHKVLALEETLANQKEELCYQGRSAASLIREVSEQTVTINKLERSIIKLAVILAN